MSVSPDCTTYVSLSLRSAGKFSAGLGVGVRKFCEGRLSGGKSVGAGPLAELSVDGANPSDQGSEFSDAGRVHALKTTIEAAINSRRMIVNKRLGITGGFYRGMMKSTSPGPL